MPDRCPKLRTESSMPDSAWDNKQILIAWQKF